jgi:hypothetical protein
MNDRQQRSKPKNSGESGALHCTPQQFLCVPQRFLCVPRRFLCVPRRCHGLHCTAA